MRVIGITGGVGAGKSSVLAYLKNNYKCKMILADDLAKELSLKGNVCYEPLIEVLGPDCLDENNEIDRRKMAEKIFNNESLLQKINSIIHPAVREEIENQIATLRNENSVDYFFIEAALLIETGYKEIVDEMWYIYTDVLVRRKRLKTSRGYSDEKIDSILLNQLSDEEFKRNSDFVVDNSFTIEESIKQINERMSMYGTECK